MFTVNIRNKNNELIISTVGADLETALAPLRENPDLQNGALYKTEIIDSSRVTDAYREGRRLKYATLIDPFINEAIIENAGGRPEKLTALLALREAIRAEFPKPL